MSARASVLTTTLSVLSSIIVFLLGAVLLLAYVLVTAIVAGVRWCRASGRRMSLRRRHDAAVTARSR
jgi:hypothetical protein